MDIERIFKIFKPRERRKPKNHLTYPGFEYRLVFRKGAVSAIKRAKGWKTNADMARELGLSRAYITMLEKTRVGVSATVISRLANCMGNLENNWWIYYELIPYGISDRNHPTWNSEKEKGQIPYKNYSESSEMRSKDYFSEKS